MTAPRKQNGVEVALIENLRQAEVESRRRSCESKHRYADEHSCRAAGIHLMPQGVQLFFYKCKYCRGYHLTKRERPPFYAVDYLEKEAYKT